MKGSCYCGFVTFEVRLPLADETVCHCSICRRTSGAPLVAWATAPKVNFRFLTGQVTSFRSSSHGTRTFCPRCGTPLTFCSDGTPTQLDFTVCSLDNAQSVEPKDHTWTSAALSWVQKLTVLPCHAEEAE